MALFERGGLQQDTGLLSERWGQQGSNIKNLVSTVNGTSTMATVTAGKSLFISQITVSNSWPGGTGVLVTDAAVTKFQIGVPGDTNETITFNTPLKFTTNVRVTTSLMTQVNMTGWEE